MPRFLNTWSGEFVWEHDAAKVHYAILSHTWNGSEDGGEQTYADILKLQAEAAQCTAEASISGSQPAHTGSLEDLPEPEAKGSPWGSATPRVPSPFFSHPKLSEKIAMACKVAREAGYELLWIDTCCIDKSSSAELAEAINSMNAWYRLSAVCYAFLADVPDGDDPPDEGSQFRKSRWHKRGWTLQELIAPQRVIFLTSTWTFLGTRRGLATTIEQRTGVDFAILIGRARVDSVCVARRMSWAARRETTRVEDRAYSLLGIFGVHMAPIYGEGENAFLRLQEEILRTVPDQTIFVWERPASISGLLTPSPLGFRDYGDVRVLSPADFASRLGLQIQDVPALQAVVTPQGVRMKLLCVDLRKLPAPTKPDIYIGLSPIAETFGSRRVNCTQVPRAHLLALLPCEDHNGRLQVLPLYCPPPGSIPAYVTREAPCECSLSKTYATPYVLDIPEATLKAHSMVLPAIDVSILHHHSHRSASGLTTLTCGRGGNLRFRPGAAHNAVDFEFSSESIQELAALGFHLSPLRCEHSSLPREGTLISFVLSSETLCRPWTNNLPRQRATLDLSFTSVNEYVVEVKFTAVNFTFGPMSHWQDVSGSTNTSGSTTNTSNIELDIPRSFVLDTASGAQLAEGSSTSKFPLRYRTLHVLAHAEFALYAGPGSPEEDRDGTVRIRWLKVLVQRSIARPADSVCIAVELSDVQLHSQSHNQKRARRTDFRRALDSSLDDIDPDGHLPRPLPPPRLRATKPLRIDELVLVSLNPS
ncbi:hypothetical protein C2E23DRAFT_890798 [Lenzites betulinus]|nr:hypothetical protein C2E23DRAFT_890798 [Lenzites betulinus]